MGMVGNKMGALRYGMHSTAILLLASLLVLAIVLFASCGVHNNSRVVA